MALAQAVIYVATAPKSNAAYVAYKKARRLAEEKGSLMPPKIILNAPTKLMREEGYGEGYEYDHDAPDAFSGPELLARVACAAEALRAGRARLRARDCQKTRLLEQIAP